jgi:hypothetical protein
MEVKLLINWPWDGKNIHYPEGSSIKKKEGRSGKTRDNVINNEPAIADFEDGGEPWTKESEKYSEAGK